MAYIGRPLNAGNLAVQSGTGDGSDTTPIATLNYATTTNGIAVYLDGVRQLAGTDYNVTAQTTLTFTTAPANGVGVDVYFLGLEVSIPTPADSSISTAKLVDNSVTLAKMAGGTDGQVITYDASGDPVAVGPGTDGQVLTSTGAGSPPAFEDAGGGAWTYISSATASTSSSLDFTSGIDSTYDVYMFCGSSIVLSTDIGVNIRVGGGSFDSGASDYKFSVTRQSVGGWNQVSDAAHNFMDMGHAQYSGGGTSEATHFRILLYSPSDTTHYKVIEAHQSGQDSSASPQNNMLVGQRDSTSAITRLQVLPSSGTITSGIIRMYGLAKS